MHLLIQALGGHENHRTCLGPMTLTTIGIKSWVVKELGYFKGAKRAPLIFPVSTSSPNERGSLTPQTTSGISVPLYLLQDHGHTLTTTYAEGGQPQLMPFPQHLIHQGHDDAGA